MVKTIVITGMLVRNPTGRKSRGDYASVDLAYNVDDSVDIDDVIFYINKSKARPVPYDLKSDEKLDFSVGIDRDRAGDVPTRLKGKVLNRVSIRKEIEKDMKGLEWFEDGAFKGDKKR
jgi:hypothetical protein